MKNVRLVWLANAVRHLLDSQAKVKMITPEEESKLFQPKGYHSKMDIQKAKTFYHYDPDGISVQHFLKQQGGLNTTYQKMKVARHEISQTSIQL